VEKTISHCRLQADRAEGLLTIDGSHGEGGGQILRTALSYAALFGRGILIENIRAARRRPGLAAQHVTCVRAAAALCGAALEGDELGGSTLRFLPRTRAQAGQYAFDVAQARKGGSAGSTSLVLQTVLLPLALADGDSRVRIEGGTHMLWSPSFHFLRDVWLPALTRTGIEAELALERWGWFPVGKGLIQADIRGSAGRRPRPLEVLQRGELLEVSGCAVGANLPAHIPSRMANRAIRLLDGLGVPLRIEPRVVRAACAGAGIFLAARYNGIDCGFAALGARGKPSEEVAAEAVESLLAHHRTVGAVDVHLADQLLVVLALADGPSRYTVPQVTRHLTTNAWLVEQFGLAHVELGTAEGGGNLVTVTPCMDGS
jgi:RNA 3'-terminal phosphate cyclase (ATP)